MILAVIVMQLISYATLRLGSDILAHFNIGLVSLFLGDDDTNNAADNNSNAGDDTDKNRVVYSVIIIVCY